MCMCVCLYNVHVYTCVYSFGRCESLASIHSSWGKDPVKPGEVAHTYCPSTGTEGRRGWGSERGGFPGQSRLHSKDSQKYIHNRNKGKEERPFGM